MELPAQCENCQKLVEKAGGEQLFAEGLALMTEAKEMAERESGKPGAHSKRSVAVFEKAAAKYREALRVNPSTRFAQCNLGTVLFELGKYQ
eukprot:3430090-Rhodomonas_salina.1